MATLADITEKKPVKKPATPVEAVVDNNPTPTKEAVVKSNLAPMVEDAGSRYLPPPPTSKATPSPPLSPPAQEKLSYEELLNKFSPYTEPTKEQLEQERKKHKRDQTISAIGDGISALSNLYFTTKGAPSMYDGNNTQSERARITYDKLLADRKQNKNAYYKALVEARKLDAAKVVADQNWKRQLGLDEDAKKKHEEDVAYRNKQVKANESKFEYEKEQDAIQNNRADKKEAREAKLADRKQTLAEQKQNDGKPKNKIGFTDGDGNQIAIDDDVWKGSKLQLYDDVIKDVPQRFSMVALTAQEKEDYVMQNWSKSPTAIKRMMELSKYSTSDESMQKKPEAKEGPRKFSPGMFSSVLGGGDTQEAGNRKKYKLGMLTKK